MKEERLLRSAKLSLGVYVIKKNKIRKEKNTKKLWGKALLISPSSLSSFNEKNGLLFSSGIDRAN